MNYFFTINVTVVFLFCMLVSTSVLADKNTLTLGIFPYVSPSKLIKHNIKFKQFLEKNTGRKISVITAPDFNEFVRRCKNKEYDMIFTAPHHGRYTELHDGYQRIAMTSHNIQGYFLVHKASSYKSIENLNGKTLTTTPPTTILTQVVLDYLHQHGLRDSDLRINHTSTHSNAIYSVLNKHSDAAVTGVKIWQKLNPKEKDKLRVLDKTHKVPGFMLMGKETLPEDFIMKLQVLAMKFHLSEAGQNYLFNGFQTINDVDMQTLDTFIDVFDTI